jgi:hypothetical protein
MQDKSFFRADPKTENEIAPIKKIGDFFEGCDLVFGFRISAYLIFVKWQQISGKR